MLHWKERFAQGPVTDFCVSFWMDSSMTSVEEVDVHKNKTTIDGDEEGKGRHQYFMLTNVVPEDKELRANLWAERLVRSITYLA